MSVIGVALRSFAIKGWFCSAYSAVRGFVLDRYEPLTAKFAEKCAEAAEKNLVISTGSHFQMSVIGVALRSLAVKGSSPKLSSIVRSTL